MSSSKLGHAPSKTRSLGQIIEKACEHIGGHIFLPIFMKLFQNLCLHYISVEFETESQSQKLGQIIEIACEHIRGRVFHVIFMKLCQKLFLDDIWVGFETESRRAIN